MVEQDRDPLFGDSPAEIALPRPPLARVLVQIRFDPIFILRKEDTIAPFQNSIRTTYPKVSQETMRLPLPLGDESEGRTEVTWRFESPDSAWRVSVAPAFLALETAKYVSRADLLTRVRSLVTNLKATVGEFHVVRIGVRYVDQVKAPELDSLHEMIRREMLGVTSLLSQERVRHTVSETFCDTAEGGIIARWGMLPPHGALDPNVLPPVPEPSWFLDIDAFAGRSETEAEMDSEAICNATEALAMRSYSFFRWVVTEKFLTVYGAELS